jgi:hypothetical protein
MVWGLTLAVPSVLIIAGSFFKWWKVFIDVGGDAYFQGLPFLVLGLGLRWR